MEMRVALVYRAFNRAGSLARATVELACHLLPRHEVHVFSIPARTDRSVAPGCTFHDVPAPVAPEGAASAAELWSYSRNARRLLAAEQFDAVHVCAPATWVGDILHVPGIVRGEAVLQGIPTWRVRAGVVRHPRNAVRLALERRALRSPTFRRLHVAAPIVRDDLARHYGIDPASVLVVPPAVNLEQFTPADDPRAGRAELGLAADRFLVLFCGSDFARKGLDRAIEAVAACAQEVELVVVGAGEEARFRDLARRSGAAERVHFLGGRTDAHRFYRIADALVLPTRADVWGVTPIEAMACGVPPIVSGAAGSSTAISDGETGIVLPEPFAVADLRDAIERLRSNPELRAAMSRAGVIAARDHSWAARGRRVEEELLAVAEAKRHTRLA
jgi:UDP-glucose:(heptosyl)LPS alpha-1,3-glucosyltransferase